MSAIIINDILHLKYFKVNIVPIKNLINQFERVKLELEFNLEKIGLSCWYLHQLAPFTSLESFLFRTKL